jgi:hypothetical protein
MDTRVAVVHKPDPDSWLLEGVEGTTPDNFRHPVIRALCWSHGCYTKDGKPILKKIELKTDRVHLAYSRAELFDCNADECPAPPGKCFGCQEIEAAEEKSFIPDIDVLKAPSSEIMYGSPYHIIDSMQAHKRQLIEDTEIIYFSNRIFKMVDPITAAKERDETGVYKYQNGAGTNIDDGIVEHDPALIAFARDLCPDNEFSFVRPIIIEAQSSIFTDAPTNAEYILIPISGIVNISIPSPRGEILLSEVLEADTKTIIRIDGPCPVVIENKADYEDSIVLLAEVSLETEDMLDLAVSSGQYQDPSIVAIDPESSFVAFIDSSVKEKEDEFDNEFGCDIEEEEDEVPVGKVSMTATSGIIPDLSNLGYGIPLDKEEQDILWKKETACKIPKRIWRNKKKVHELISRLSNRFDSPYFARGHLIPKPNWVRIIQERHSFLADAAMRREQTFSSLLAEAKSMKTAIDLYGEDRQSGFYGKIRKINALDRDIVNKWSEKPGKVKDKNGNWKEIPSRFQVLREKYIERLKKGGFSDKEIDAKVWHWFDRKGGKQEAVYEHLLRCHNRDCNLKEIEVTVKKEKIRDKLFVHTCTLGEITEIKCPSCGVKPFERLVSRLAEDRYGKKRTSHTVDDSIWRQDRTKAFAELTLRRSQWDVIYKQLEIQKERMHQAVNRTPGSTFYNRQRAWNKNRDNAMSVMRGIFLDIENRKELDFFREEIYRQVIKHLPDGSGYIMKPSLIDYVSFGDEINIRAAILKKSKEISSR